MRQVGAGDQVIVWDNNSADSTGQLLDQLASRWPSLIVHRASRNLGFAAGNNAAAQLAAKEADLFLLNPDAILKPGALDAMRDALQSDAQIAAVGAVQLSADESTVDGVGDAYHFTGLPWREGYGDAVDSRFDHTLRQGDLTVEIFGPCAAAALYRREAFDTVSGFDEDYFCYCEDVDLAFRLRNCGWRCVRANNATVLHAGSVSTGKDSDFSVYHGHRNMVWTFFKNMPLSLLLVFVLPHLLMILLVTARFVWHGRTETIFRARVDALRGLGRVFSKRRRVQLCRQASALDIWRVLDKSLWRRSTRASTPMRPNTETENLS